MTIRRTVLYALVLSIITSCGESDTADNALDITARDVAWATEWDITKFDLSDAGAFYAVGLVVLDDQSNIIKASSGNVGFDEPEVREKNKIVTTAMQKNGTSVDARFQMAGNSLNTTFKDMFKSDRWYTHGRPRIVDDLYFLCGDAKTVRYGPTNTDLEPGSHHIALKLYRTEQEWDDRPQ